jgi:hypothetical protein
LSFADFLFFLAMILNCSQVFKRGISHEVIVPSLEKWNEDVERQISVCQQPSATQPLRPATVDDIELTDTSLERSTELDIAHRTVRVPASKFFPILRALEHVDGIFV